MILPFWGKREDFSDRSLNALAECALESLNQAHGGINPPPPVQTFTWPALYQCLKLRWPV